jgi:L-serine dehydratase
MRAARRFVLSLEKSGQFNRAAHVRAELFGSLALTGQGHGTDRAVLLGLSGEEPSTIDPETIEAKLQQIRSSNRISLAGKKVISFREASDLIFHRDQMYPEGAQTQHPNGMRFSALADEGSVLASEVFFSIGGGFIVSDAEGAGDPSVMTTAPLPYPFKNAEELLQMASAKQLSIWDLMFENESSLHSREEVRSGILHIWNVMQGCVDRGMTTEGILPGGLNVRRRA